VTRKTKPFLRCEGTSRREIQFSRRGASGLSAVLARRRRLPRPPRKWVRRTGARSTVTPVQLSCQIFWSGYLSQVTKGTRGELESRGSKSGARNLVRAPGLLREPPTPLGRRRPDRFFPFFLHCTVFNLLLRGGVSSSLLTSGFRRCPDRTWSNL
jgi:hypothetical protein